MAIQWSHANLVSASGESRAWAALACPRCAGITLIEVVLVDVVNSTSSAISDYSTVDELRCLPSESDGTTEVRHLPDDVAAFFSNAHRVLDAGVPDAAAVQLRKTLEAAAAHKEVNEKTLYESVKKLIAEGYVTQDFSKLLDHVRKIGNIGAHYTDARLDTAEVERAMRFTTQILRNLFEVPGELAALEEQAPAV